MVTGGLPAFTNAAAGGGARGGGAGQRAGKREEKAMSRRSSPGTRDWPQVVGGGQGGQNSVKTTVASGGQRRTETRD